jgi:hypothetical protein
MRTRTTLTAATLLAASALVGGLTSPTVGQVKQSEPGARTASSFTPAQLAERSLHRRAVEVVIWGMPAVNFQLMYQEMTKIGGDYNQIVYWSRLLDWKNQTLTPNPDVIYLMPFFNTEKVGPIVLEVPLADEGLFNGSIMDYWQAAIEDIGPGGVDKGKGGKYLFLPPNYKERVPNGYIPLRSDTYRGYALIRSVLKSGSDEDVAKALAYSKRLKLYPLSQAADPPATKFVNASDVVFDATIPYNLRFFETLNQIVQAEPWLERDKAMIDPLKTIGIERGKPFKPDERTKQNLSDAIREAKAWLETRYGMLPPYCEGERWFFPTTEEMALNVRRDWRIPDSYPTDARGLAYSLAFFSAKHLGESQYYLLTDRDKDGKHLEGNSSYRLRTPANAPVTQYWSMTVYNRETHAFIRHAKWVGRC